MASETPEIVGTEQENPSLEPVWDEDFSDASSLDEFYRLQPGGMVPDESDKDRPENDYAWLDLVDEDNSYMPLELSNSRPSKSLDFGRDGYTGSLSTWHELLQITAPDPTCGLVFVRGDFPDSADSILARAQRRNGRGTFGMSIKIPDDANPMWVQEPTVAQGMINLRWPCTRLNWVLEDRTSGSDHFASFTECSFVRSNTIYQIARIVPRTLTRPASPSASTEDLRGGEKTERSSDRVRYRIDVGGIIRFGCPKTAAKHTKSRDNYTVTPDYEHKAHVLSCASDVHRKRLEIRLWINREQQVLERHRCDSPVVREHGCGPEDRFPHTAASLHTITEERTFPRDRATVIVASFTLVDIDAHGVVNTNHKVSVPPYKSVQRCLGIADSTRLAPYRLWSTLLGLSSGADSFELNAVGRSVEAILGVASLPLGQPKATSSNAIPKWPNGNATSTPGASPGIAVGIGTGLAPLKNIITPQNADLESAFWQVRLLVKASLLLKSEMRWPTNDGIPERKKQQFARMKDRYRSDIIDHVRKICLWVLSIIQLSWHPRFLRDLGVGNLLLGLGSETAAGQTCVSPCECATCARERRSSSANNASTASSNAQSDRKYYCSMIVWYVMSMLPEVFQLDEPESPQTLESSSAGMEDAKLAATAKLEPTSSCTTDREGVKPPLSPSSLAREKLWEQFTGFAFVQGSGKSRLESRLVAIDDPNGCIIRWYHNHCLVSICKMLHKADANRFAARCTAFMFQQENQKAQAEATPRSRLEGREEVNTGMTPMIDIQALTREMVTWQVKAEKSMRLFEHGRLSGRNLGHEVAILAKLGPELGIENKGITALGKSCLGMAKDLIKARKDTTKLSPGRSKILRWDSRHDVRSARPRPAPWEINCLAQHLPFNLGIRAGDAKSRDVCLDRCKEFMFSDYSFMGSWDASKATTVGHWWDFDTSSIVCAKLLDEEIENLEGGCPSPKGQIDQDGEDEKTELLRKIYALQKDANARTDDPGFNWRRRKPKMLYHSDTAARSFRDTSEVHVIKQKAEVRLRPNIWHHRMCNFMPDPGRTMEAIRDSVGPSKLHNLSCFDFFLTADRNDYPEISDPIPKGRADYDYWRRWTEQDATEGAGSKQRKELFRLFGILNNAPGTDGGDPESTGSIFSPRSLMDLYLIGMTEPIERSVRAKYPLLKELDDPSRGELLSRYHDNLLTVLNNSLVDQGVKYRIIFAKQLSPVTLQAMVYLWHPDAVDTFDDHLGDLSNFNDTTIQSLTGSEDMWITSITLKQWRLLDEEGSKVRQAERNVDDEERRKRKSKRMREQKEEEERRAREEKVKEARWRAETETGGTAASSSSKAHWDRSADEERAEETFKFPPYNVRDSRPRQVRWSHNVSHHLSKIHELGLSLVFTGDETGRSWTCSIICELFDEDHVARYATEVSHILQMFIHQQYTGRQLAFLLLLGYMCERLAEECDLFMAELDGIMKLNPKVLLEGMEWEKSDQALRRLKQMLWGFEALRVFDDKLKSAIEVVNKAREKMYALLDQAKASRHKDMASGVAQVMEEFDKRRGRLENSYNSLQQRVDQGTKLREGISSVLSVEQNENISMLTWLTIIYLGPGLLTGVFGMGHGIVPESEGWYTFSWMLGALVGGTLVFAFCLRYIIEAIRRLIINPFGRWIYRPTRGFLGEAAARAVEQARDMYTSFRLRHSGEYDRGPDIETPGRARK